MLQTIVEFFFQKGTLQNKRLKVLKREIFDRIFFSHNIFSQWPKFTTRKFTDQSWWTVTTVYCSIGLLTFLEGCVHDLNCVFTNLFNSKSSTWTVVNLKWVFCTSSNSDSNRTGFCANFSDLVAWLSWTLLASCSLVT